MLNTDAQEDYRKALMEYAQAKESLELAWSERNRALTALMERDSSLVDVVERALKNDGFYERLKVSMFDAPNNHGLDVSLN